MIRAACARYSFRLYVAGGSPNSARAVENLRALGARALGGCYDLEIVDVLRDPRRLLEDAILVTPTLLKLAPHPAIRIIGDLSNEALVAASLGLPSQPPG